MPIPDKNPTKPKVTDDQVTDIIFLADLIAKKNHGAVARVPLTGRPNLPYSQTVTSKRNLFPTQSEPESQNQLG